MSKAKLVAAKELIQEKRYAEARALLKTVNDPIAIRWLEQLDSIAPEIPVPPTHGSASPPPSRYDVPYPISAEAERYYRRENKRMNRRRIGNAVRLIGIGILCFLVYSYTSQPVPSIRENGAMVINVGLGWVFVPLGIVAILAGLVLIMKRD